jgi:hypothetical protein
VAVLSVRTAVLATAIAIVALLAFLTLYVLLSEGLSVLVALSILVVGLLAYGVLGAVR